jgi:hypothetical protein
MGVAVSHRAKPRRAKSSLLGIRPKVHQLPRRGLLIYLSYALATAACAKPVTSGDLAPSYDKSGRLKLLRWDSDHDGKIDTTAYMDGAKILRVEIDKDEDGKTDRWEYYDDHERLTKVGTSRANDGKEDMWSYVAPDGSSSRIELSTNRDGRVTRTEYYERGALVRAEEDSDEDGAVDKWETWENGRLAAVSFDTDHAGHPSHRLLYSADGTVKAEADPDGSGQWRAAASPNRPGSANSSASRMKSER